MADSLTDALESLQNDSLLPGTKTNVESFIDGEKDVEGSQFMDDSEKVGFDFEVNLQPEKILEVATLPVSRVIILSVLKKSTVTFITSII